MNKIRVSDTGEVDIKSIEDLSYDELKAWIELRLHGKDTQIPTDFRQGDTPYYIISLFYPKFSRFLREDIHRIVGEFIRDMARTPDTIWKGEAGHQLLLLANSISAKETIGLLLEMAKSCKFFVEDSPSLVEDQHFRVLQTLVSLGYRTSSEFWSEQYSLAPERYAKIVFNGLALIAPEQAIRFMALIDSVETVERILLITFPSLLNDNGVARIALLVEKYLPKMQPGVRAAVQSFFEDEGYTLEYQPKLRRDLQRVNEKNRELFELAIRDGLTNLYSRRFFREQLEREINKGPLSIVMFDTDNFKGYNDTHGHLKGDDVLRQMAEVLESTVRDTDIVARYGGDEFMVILPDTDKSSAAKFAQRCVQLIAEYYFEGEELIPSGKITISAGVASYPDDATNSALLIDNADNACYRAKETGKNGVYICKGMDFEQLSS